MSIAGELLVALHTAAARIPLPPVARLWVPARSPGAGIEGEFGVVVLADGSAGFFFALLGQTLERLRSEVHATPDATDVRALAAGIESADEVERAVALGTLVAATAHVFRRAGYVPPPARNALGGGDFGPGDRVGMVGLFPSLVERLRARGVPLTVLELRPEKVTCAAGFEVTLDPRRLAGCTRVLCTASTLINGTLEAVLAHCDHRARIAVIGPSAGGFPDPLFARGVEVVGGTTVRDARGLLARLERGERWGDAVERYAIEAAGYPGLDALLDRAVVAGDDADGSATSPAP